MAITHYPTADNGVNVEALLGARSAMTDAPEAAKFQWKAVNEWVAGTHSRTTVQQFFGIGEPQSHKQAFRLDTDHPELFASADSGVTPPEMVLAGLAGCLTPGSPRLQPTVVSNFVRSRPQWKPIWTSRASSELTPTFGTVSAKSGFTTTLTPTPQRTS